MFSTSKVRLISLPLLLLSLFSGQSGCKKAEESVNDLYKFDGTKDVRVQIVVDYQVKADDGLAVAVSEQQFYLNAFTFSDEERQVQIRRPDEALVHDLPVTLNSTHLVFDAIVRIPATTKAGVNGYAIHFSLKEKGAALGMAEQSTVKNLEALKGGIQPGTASSANVVPLSIATTLAYRLTTAVNVDDGSATHVDLYEGLSSHLSERLLKVEAKLDPTKTPDLAVYSAAVSAGLNLELVSDQTLQAKLMEVLAPGVKALLGDAAALALITTFTDLAKALLAEAKAVFTASGSEELAIYKNGEIDPTAIPDPEQYASIIFAPAAIGFTDTDFSAAIAGNVLITAPAYKEGIESYNVYFGGQTMAEAKGRLAGSVLASADPLVLAIPAKTALATAHKRIWVFPVVDARELTVATSVLIDNATKLMLQGKKISGLPACQNEFRKDVLSVTGDIIMVGDTRCELRSAPGTIASARHGFLAAYSNLGVKKWIVPISPGPVGTAFAARSRGVASDKDGFIYVTGWTNGNVIDQVGAATGNEDVFVAKYDASGTKIWAVQISGMGVEAESNGIQVDNLGHVYVSGYADGQLTGGPTFSGFDSDAILYKLNTSNGSVVWSTSVPAVASFAVADSVNVAPDGSAVYIAGQCDGEYGSGARTQNSVFVAAFNASTHARTWLFQTFEANGTLDAPALAVVKNGTRIVVAGSGEIDVAAGTASGQQLYSLTLNASGARVDAASFQTPTAHVDDMKVDSDGAIYVSGVNDDSTFGSQVGSGSDMFIVKYRPDHTVAWSKQFGVDSGQDSFGTGLLVDGSGQVLMSGNSEGNMVTGSGATPSGSRDGYFFLLDANGNPR